ncbi:AraC family transcriptional regulator [Paraburkholderia dipogonis]|uniref:AraC family transcriptional regulator n=1 Tax=Paraburkholderia dipogonis TaxID=1211383 RepID=UPI0038B96EEF
MQRITSSRFDSDSVLTTIGGYALAISRALEHNGVDSARIFQAAGIAPSLLKNDPMSRLPVATMARLFKVCVDVTHNPYFGLTVAKFIHVSNLHALGYALAASSNLMAFCQRLERFFKLASEACEITLVANSDEVALRMRLLVPVCAETEDALMGFVVLSMRQLYHANFAPVRVVFSHAMPREGSGPYEKLFRAPVEFDQAQPEIVFPRADLEQPLTGACAELAQLHDNLAVSYIARLDKNDVVSAVRQKIIEYLPNGDCSRDKVASAMCISPTTLQFKLSQHDTNFNELLDATRRELAASYVQQSALSITEITFLLGFNDSSNFTRAFKRWEGVSPSDYRKNAKIQGA